MILNDTNIKKLKVIALYAQREEDFRKEAIKNPYNLDETIANEQELMQEINAAGAGDLTEVEFAYCLAWASLAKFKVGEDDDAFLHAIAKTISNHREPGG